MNEPEEELKETVGRKAERRERARHAGPFPNRRMPCSIPTITTSTMPSPRPEMTWKSAA